MAEHVSRPLHQVGIFVAAFVAGIAGTMLMLPLGLAVPAGVIFPTAVAFGALLAALAAAWAGNLSSPDHSRTQLLAVVGATELAAVLTAVLVIVGAFLIRLVPVMVPAAVGLIIVALAATMATQRFRSPGRSVKRDILLSLGLVGLGVALIVATITVTCSVTRCVP